MADGGDVRPAGQVQPGSDARATPVAELLALAADADPLARLRELAGETPGGAVALVDALGATRSAEAVPVLTAAAAQGTDKELRKAARRALHRLQSVGVAVAPPPPAPEPARPAVQQPRLTEVQATAPDGLGSRVLWLRFERPYRGVLSYALVLNDVVGVKDCAFEETTRRRMTERMRDWLATTELTAIALPGDYALALVSEALALNAETGFTVPRDFLFHRSGLGELPPPPTDALIYRHVTRGQAFLLPDLVDTSPALLEEKELQSWFFGHDESIRFARELRQVRESRLVLTAEPREAREQRTVDTAIDALFTPAMRRAIRRRLEEVAYVFWTTGRERAARQAVAAAGGIGAGSLGRHPFACALVEKSLNIAVEAEEAGLDPALLRRSPYDRMD